MSRSRVPDLLAPWATSGHVPHEPRDWRGLMRHAAVAVGLIRAAFGLSFLVAPERAQRLWSAREATDPTARLLLRSMGYRDALVGGCLLRAGLRDSPTTGRWFLASAGADAADLVGGLANRHELSERDHVMGIGGAALGVAIGLGGWWSIRASACVEPS